jgi:spore photoproduct lyase
MEFYVRKGWSMMLLFIPKVIYYEEAVTNYPLGNELLDRYKSIGIPCKIIENHNNIEEMRSQQNNQFPSMKQNLIIGIRKSLKYVPNTKTSDFLVPYTSSGCSAMCLYCYLVCNYNKCAYLRLFVNREEMMNKLIKTANASQNNLTFEIGSNSDLILENTITQNLEWTIEEFAKSQKGFITLPTKFDMVDSLLTLNHQGKTIIRMSLNPDYIIKRIEIGTSSLPQRVNALNKLYKSDYKIGILIAPVIMVENWKEYYQKMLEYLSENLEEKAKNKLGIEIIFMTYSYIHRMINNEAFPNAPQLFDTNLMSARGIGKYAYKKDLKEDAENFFRTLISKYLPNARIEYIV